ncbi:TetR/AcrR family transcriptional regulator [Nocardia cyriacigeorgica]|uniref:TetR/AcrR family transcriptional regulator n=1 Tax=Nocardia cyriacigeorgica TaxID=135487 RepID=A0A6P1CYX9_9NOCA|nr:TetR/AcrR family transcriptional regulator [Nocardia cyriacigeorgica]NEW43336.1 TetR/AcrR family transcriptional regulator [Nocardia cyriacigeorgica]NEW48870.1 TetR/AcrR family transcriptional regulator [Nocardia cyriacigeorgica]
MATTKQAGGRPRESRVDHSIAAAVRGLLEERGYASLTVDAVAARAGVSKAAIYRRYATKQEMTFAVLLHDLREDPPGDTGSLRGDLGALAERIGEQLSRSSSDVMTGLLADVRADASLGDRFAGTYLAVERTIITTLLDRAVSRGELSRRPDPAVVHVLLLGPLFAWLIMLDEDPAGAPDLARAIARIASDALVANIVPADQG